MKKMRSAQLGLCLVVLVAASCDYPRLPELVDGSGGGGSDEPPALGLELLAGNIGGSGHADGTGAAARFSFPSGMALDSAGNVYVADTGNHTIRKVTAAGVVTTLAGTAGMTGSADGAGAAARFNSPAAVAVDSGGNVYVADQDNNTIRKVTATGVVTTLAGTAGMSGSADGIGAAARFSGPAGVAVDSAGNVYVTEFNNFTIRRVTNGVVTTLAGSANMSGSTDGTGAAARFGNLEGVAVDSAGNIYVADFSSCTIRKVTASGVATTLAGTAGMQGSADGTGAAARFLFPEGIAVDSAGNLYVTDQGNNTIRKVTASGVTTTLAGTAGMYGSADGTGAAARFAGPTGVTVGSAGNLYVTDADNDTIRNVTTTGSVTTLAGTAGTTGGSADGTGAAARFLNLTGMAVDSAGNLYIADGPTFISDFPGESTIRKVTPAGVVTTLGAGGTGAAARFSNAAGVAVSSAGNVYVTEQSSEFPDPHPPFFGDDIREVTAGGVVTTLAGQSSGFPGSADGTGPAAGFYHPAGVALDSAGDLYVADSGNRTIRKVTAGGVVTTLAGTAGMLGSADGTGAAARFGVPTSVALDGAGNIYVADKSNDTIRKITASGVVTTLAGTAGMIGSADGAGAAARFAGPTGVTVDSAGNIYVADTGNSTIRKITPTGITTTVAGTAGVAGILLGATPRFAFPKNLAIVGDSIVVSDTSAVLLLRHGAQ